MKIFTKVSMLFLLVFLSGCAHHSGYYSGHSNNAAFGISVDSYLPYRSYSAYYDRDVYLQRPVKHKKYRDYKPHYDKRSYGKHDRYEHGHGKHESKRRDKKHNKYYAYKRNDKGKRGRVNRWNAPATRHDYNYR